MQRLEHRTVNRAGTQLDVEREPLCPTPCCGADAPLILHDLEGTQILECPACTGAWEGFAYITYETRKLAPDELAHLRRVTGFDPVTKRETPPSHFVWVELD